MSTQPRDLPTPADCLAAQYFGPAPGMRAQLEYGLTPNWKRLTEFDFDGGVFRHERPIAYDTSDPATAGCMESQLKAQIVEVRRSVRDDREADVLAAVYLARAKQAVDVCIASMRGMGGDPANLPAFAKPKAQMPAWWPTGFHLPNNARPPGS